MLFCKFNHPMMCSIDEFLKIMHYIREMIFSTKANIKKLKSPIWV